MNVTGAPFPTKHNELLRSNDDWNCCCALYHSYSERNLDARNLHKLMKASQKVECHDQCTLQKIPPIISVPEVHVTNKNSEQKSSKLVQKLLQGDDCSRCTAFNRNRKQDIAPSKTSCSPRPATLLQRQKSESHSLSTKRRTTKTKNVLSSSPMQVLDEFKIKRDMIESTAAKDQSSEYPRTKRRRDKSTLSATTGNHQDNQKDRAASLLKSSQDATPKICKLRRPRSEPALHRTTAGSKTQENTAKTGTKNEAWSTSSSNVSSQTDDDRNNAMKKKKAAMEDACILCDHSHGSTSTTSTADSSSSFTNSIIYHKDHQKKEKNKKNRSSLHRPKSEPSLRRTSRATYQHSPTCTTKNAVWSTSSSSAARSSGKSLNSMRKAMEDVGRFSHDQSCSSTAGATRSPSRNSCNSHQTVQDICSVVNRKGPPQLSLRRQQSEPQLGQKKCRQQASLSVQADSVDLAMKEGKHPEKSHQSTRCFSTRHQHHNNKEAKETAISTETMILQNLQSSSCLRRQRSDSQLVDNSKEEPNDQPKARCKTRKISTSEKSSSFASVRDAGQQKNAKHSRRPRSESRLTAAVRKTSNNRQELPEPVQEQEGFNSPVLAQRLISHTPVAIQGGLTTTITHQQRSIELKSGVVLRWRDSAETAQCIEQGNQRFTTCHACGQGLCCLPDASYMLCPDCKFATPLQSNFNAGLDSMDSNGGIALDASLELVQLHYRSVVWQEQQYRKFFMLNDSQEQQPTPCL